MLETFNNDSILNENMTYFTIQNKRHWRYNTGDIRKYNPKRIIKNLFILQSMSKAVLKRSTQRSYLTDKIVISAWHAWFSTPTDIINALKIFQKPCSIWIFSEQSKQYKTSCVQKKMSKYYLISYVLGLTNIN